MFSGSNGFFNFFSDSFRVTFIKILFSQQFLNCDILGNDLIFVEDARYPLKSSALQWRWGLCDPTILRAILAEALASGRFYQARQVKGQDPDKQMIESLAAGQGQCSQADTTRCILAMSYCCSEENTAIVGRCCVHQLSNQQPKENYDE